MDEAVKQSINQINLWLQELNVPALDANFFAPYIYQNYLIGINVVAQAQTLFIRAPFFELKDDNPQRIAVLRRLLNKNYFFKDTYYAFFSVQKSNTAGTQIIFLNSRRMLNGLNKQEFLKAIGSVAMATAALLPALKQEFQL